MSSNNRLPAGGRDFSHEQQARAMQQQIQKQHSTNVSRASMHSGNVPTGRTTAMPHLQHTPAGFAYMGSAPSAHQPNSIRSQFPTTYPPAHIRSAAQTDLGSLRPHITLAEFENVSFFETDGIATKFNHWRWVNDMRMTPIPWLVPSLPMSQRPAVFRNTLAQVPNDLTRDEGQHEQSTQKQPIEDGKIFQAAEQVQEQPASATQSQNQWTNYIDLGDEDNDADFVLDK